MAIEVWQVEDEKSDAFCADAVERVLQCIEVRDPVGVQDDRLTVEPSAPDAECRSLHRQAGHFVRPVVPVPREEPALPVFDARQKTVAIELDLVDPVP